LKRSITRWAFCALTAGCGSIITHGTVPAALARDLPYRSHAINYRMRNAICAASCQDASRRAIAAASRRYGVSYAWLLRVATCESGLNPSASNPSGAQGLFQFMSGTYATYAARSGVGGSVWAAVTSARVAAYMFKNGMSDQWSCR